MNPKIKQVIQSDKIMPYLCLGATVFAALCLFCIVLSNAYTCRVYFPGMNRLACVFSTKVQLHTEAWP